MDAQTAAFLDQYRAHITSTIRRHGWFIQYVGGQACSRPGCDCPPSDEPPFAYTIGLFGLDHPELLLLGVDPETTAALINELCEQIRSGRSLVPGVAVEIDGWPYTIVPEVVPNAGDIVFNANSFYQRPDEASVPVLQLTYPDECGRFPWDAGCEVADQQPRPGTFAA